MSSWRVGKKLGRTLYLDDQCIGMVDTPELAAEIVAAMNRRTPAVPADQRPGRTNDGETQARIFSALTGTTPIRAEADQRPARACELLGTWAADAVQIGEDGPECRACGCLLDNEGRGHSRCAVPVIEEALRLFDGQRAGSRVRSFVAELAEEACVYGDGCPDFSGTRHGDCQPCKARKAIEADRAGRQSWPVPPGWNGGWGNGLAEAIERLRVHAGPREEGAAPPPRFDARDRLALGYVLEVVARPPRDVQGEGSAGLFMTGQYPQCTKCGSILIPHPAGNAMELRCVNCGTTAAAPLPEKEPPR